jgi:O-antigen/teichoic acid export membrane protein
MPAAAQESPRTGRFGDLGRSLREHAARGAMINGAFLVGLSALGVFKGFVMAGLVSTGDYGRWGILGASLGTLLWLKDVGIGDKYIQQEEEDQERAFQKAFTLELVFTGGFVVLLAATLPLYSRLYGVSGLVGPGLLLLLALVVSLLQTPLWVFYRRMQFGRQRLLQAVEPVVGLIVSVALGVAGAGIWALAGGALAGVAAAAVAVLLFAPFKLRLRYDRGTLRSYVGFSWPLVLASGSGVVIAQSAALATQRHLGLAAVGALTVAAIITSFTDRVDHLVTGTLYPAICAVKDDIALLSESFVKSNRLALMWAVPFGGALTLFCSDLVTFGIGEKWRPAVDLLRVYGVLAAVGHVGFNWDAYFRARGETKPLAVASAGAMVTFLVAGIPLLLRYDIPGFAAGVVLQGLVLLAFRAYFLQRLFHGFSFLRHALRAFLPTIPAAGAVLALRLVEPGGRTLALAIAELSLYAAITLLATWRLESELLREAVGYLRPAGRPGTAPSVTDELPIPAGQVGPEEGIR